MQPDPKPRPYRGLIFDLDGVIIATEPLHEEAKRIAYSDFGLLVPEKLFGEFRGRSDEDMAGFVTRTYGPPGLSHLEVLEHKHEVFESLQDRMETVEGVLEFIRTARLRFEKLAVATSATRKNQLYAFQRFGLGPYFDAVVTAADITRTKPHPEPYLTAAARLGLSPDACLVIEDSKNGILSAKAAGCAVAAITTSSTPPRAPSWRTRKPISPSIHSRSWPGFSPFRSLRLLRFFPGRMVWDISIPPRYRPISSGFLSFHPVSAIIPLWLKIGYQPS